MLRTDLWVGNEVDCMHVHMLHYMAYFDYLIIRSKSKEGEQFLFYG